MRLELDDLTYHQVTAESVSRKPFQFYRFYQDPGNLLRIAQLFADAIDAIGHADSINQLAFVTAREALDDTGDGLLPLMAFICTDGSLWLPNVVVRLDRAAVFNEEALFEQRVLALFGHLDSSEDARRAVSVLRNRKAEVRHALAFSVSQLVGEDVDGVGITSFFLQKEVGDQTDVQGRLLVPQTWLMKPKEPD